MADEEKTEQATPKKRQEAREKGQVAKSVELNTAFLLLVSIIYFYYNIDSFGNHFKDAFVYFIGLSSHYELTLASFPKLVKEVTYIMFVMLLPFLVLILLVSLFINIVQVGFMITPKAMELKFDKLNPINGLKNMFSMRSFGELIKSILKASVISYVLYLFIKSQMPKWFDLIDTSKETVFIMLLKSIFLVSVYILIFVVMVAILDYLFQRYNFEKSIRMSHKEIKDEFKQMEGDPHVKQKIRRMQMEMAKKRMMEDVKKADVVITNPTHYAVALKYEDMQMNAPRVVAKGVNLIAEKIKEIAKENDVDIVEKPEIARELYKKVKIGDEIPQELYQVVAEILAYVFKAKKERAS
jgi:flagellar biosynthetic protein FlhB